MNGSDFVDQLQKQFRCNQTELAKILGINVAQLSGMRAKETGALTVARLMAKLQAQILQGNHLIEAVKTRFALDTDRKVAEVLGVTQQSLTNWKSKGTGISKKQIGGLVESIVEHSRKKAHETAIQPIVELYPINLSPEEKPQIIPTGPAAGKHLNGLKAVLEKAIGIYIFYDTRGRALYAGQTKDQTLWKEMNDAFNRNRSAQKVTLVKHPDRDVQFLQANEKARQPKDRSLRLHDLARYFSAYQVHREMIDDIEALLIRAFPNDLLNFKMQTIGKAAKKAAKKAKK